MTSNKSAGIALSERDLAVILYAWQNRLVLTRQIQRKFWPGRSIAATAARLGRLRDEGLLGYTRIPWLPEPVLYSSSLKGNRALIEHGLPGPPHPPVQERDFPTRPGDFTNTMKHDLDVVDLRIALEESGLVDRWVSDHQLRLAARQLSDNSRTADGMFRFERHGRGCHGILEYERVGYRETRCVSVLNRLKALHPDATVFFVARSAGRAKTLRSWARSTPWTECPAQLQFGIFEDVVSNGLAANFRDLDDQRLKIQL
jgi:hypothetical protein